jgi:predicted component of type VI protein secretion system
MTATDWVVVTEVTENGQTDRVVPIVDRLTVGRKQGSIDTPQLVLLEDPMVSRAHLELRAEAAGGVVLVDQSTNGTRVNGTKVEPGEPAALRDGDLIEIGSARLGFRSLDNPERIPAAIRAAVVMTEPTLIACAAGAITGDGAAGAGDALFAALRELQAAHGASAYHEAGDSFFAAWDGGDDPQAVERAVSFAVAAGAIAAEPLRVGWAVTAGDATEAHTSTTCQAVHSEAINLALRLAGVAAREDEPAVLVSAEVADAAPAAALYGEIRELDLRGRSAPARVQTVEPAA